MIRFPPRSHCDIVPRERRTPPTPAPVALYDWDRESELPSLVGFDHACIILGVTATEFDDMAILAERVLPGKQCVWSRARLELIRLVAA